MESKIDLTKSYIPTWLVLATLGSTITVGIFVGVLMQRVTNLEDVTRELRQTIHTFILKGYHENRITYRDDVDVDDRV
jgi:hypothetical protein